MCHGWTDGRLASVHVERIFQVEYLFLSENQMAITWVHIFLLVRTDIDSGLTKPKKSRVNVLGVMTEQSRVWFSAGTRDFSLFQFMRRALGPTKPPIQWVSVFFLGLKRPGHDVDHSSPLNAEFKNKWSYTSIHPICLRDVDWDNLTFFITCKIYYWLRKKRCYRA